mgnify:CR=1 FL=1
MDADRDLAVGLEWSLVCDRGRIRSAECRSVHGITVRNYRRAIRSGFPRLFHGRFADAPGTHRIIVRDIPDAKPHEVGG